MSKSILIGLVIFIDLLLIGGLIYLISTGRTPFIQNQNLANVVKPTPSITPSATLSPLPSKDPSNNVDVVDMDLKSEFMFNLPKGKLLFINQAYLTDTVPSSTKTLKTVFTEEQEVFLILESTEDTIQNADVYVQDLNRRNFNIKYSIKISKGFGYLSIGTSLPPSRYRAILNQENKGLVLNFIVK